ncbi:MAG: protein-glutamine gamma-glutamyltransferase [Gaiellales bacterium]|nr:protein-glutamine gamma-glutamyltransferase [Gaiellales bacterium]
MSTAAIARPAAARRPARARSEPDPRRELPLRLVAFFALATFCAAHYAVLVVDSSGVRVVGLVLVATGGGAALALTNRLRGASGLALRVAIVLVTSAAALVVTGVDASLLLPGHWDEVRTGLDRGFSGLDSFSWPYGAGDHWVRLTLLLAMPMLVAPAALLAFWPAKRDSAARVLRWLALALLLVAYGTGTTQLSLSGWALRGAALLVVMAAWLWLPRLRPRDTFPAALAVLGCGLLALPLAAGFDRSTPWLAYRSWDWFHRTAVGTVFTWDHSYGPISWSRSGVTLLTVKAREPHYWKAETLSRFDGIRWLNSAESFSRANPLADIPRPIDRRWVERVRFTVQDLRTPVIVGAGPTFRIDSGKVTSTESDGTVRILDSPLQSGDAYSVDTYVPDPSAAEMRAAPAGFPFHLLEDTAFALPRPGDSGRRPVNASESAFGISARTVERSVPGAALPASTERRVLASPYGRTYQLAQRLAAGQATRYDTVKSIQSYLQHGFQYSEKPPRRRYPLASFLFDDKIGYCQQFSGAMALMLRMDGIPARVAGGFTPGNFDHVAKEYRVRDFDAHSWVEVWFSGIGWVPFDPTPSLSPASFQSDSVSATSAARGAAADHGATDNHKRLDAPGGPSSSGTVGSDGGASHWWLLGLILLVVLPLTVALLWITSVLRRRPHFHGRAEGAVEELRQALPQLGHVYPARTTLSELERRLKVTAGPEAARYVRLLRQQRYAPPGSAEPPTARDRRALRRALTEGAGPVARLRGLLALPPHTRFTAD